MSKTSIRWFLCLAAFGLLAAPSTPARPRDGSAPAGEILPGPFAVGFRVLEEVDRSRATGPKRDFTGALQPGTSALPVPISVWYPARPGTGEPFEYGTYLALDRTHKRGSFGPITDADRAEAADWLDRLSRFGLQRPLADEEREAILRRPVAARTDAVAAEGRFPLVLAGLYGTQAANMLAEHLASHGYVVATGPMSPEVSSRQNPAPQLAIETQTRNLELILARVRELPFVDPLRLGLLGVNFDGFGVLNVQMRNMQADVVISLDGWEGKAHGAEVMTESPYFDPVRLRVPYLLFTMDVTGDDRQHDPDPALFDRLVYSERSFYAIDGVTHPYYIGDLLAWPHLEDEVAPSYGFLYGTVRRWLDAYVKEDSQARRWLEHGSAEDGFGEVDLAFERHGAALSPVPTREEFVELIETDVERAERVLRDALAADPSVELVSMQTLHQLAFRARQREAWDEAAAVNRIKTIAFPGSTQAWFDLGNALREADRSGEAAEAYREALEVLAEDPSVAAAEREATRRQILDRLGTVVPSEDDPGPRSAHALSYHDGLRRVVLIGGLPEDQESGVWAWDGARWSRIGDDRGPGSRGHFALAFDPVAQRLLLHGGFGLRFGGPGGTRHGDLWAWSGDGWQLVHDATAGPGERDHHAMAWDAQRSELVLFGGNRGVPGDQESLGDTWIWNGDGWRHHEGPGPPARSTHRLAYDEHRGRVVLFGGFGEEGLLGDTWEWDGRSWRQVAESGPEPRFAARLAYDAALRRVVLYGGRGEAGDLGDVWEWDGEAWTRIGDAGPGPRNVHGMAYDAERRRIVVYGGLSDQGRHEDTWERVGRRWRRSTPAEPAPAARGAAAAAWNGEEGRLLLFGGIGAEPAAYGDFWSWQGGRWQELAVGSETPSPRFNAAAAWLESRRQLVVYGGGDVDEKLGDTWVYEDGAWRSVEEPGPPTRYCARMVARPDRGDVLLYGGVDAENNPLAETWRWDGETWSRIAEGGPPGVCFHAMAYDEERGQVVHFGGRGTENQGRDTWVFDDAGWRRVHREGPVPRDHHAMAFDPVRREVVLTGGGGRGPGGEWDGSALGDTWLWNGEGWTRRDDPEGPRRHHAPSLVGTPSGVLLFGGADESGSRGDLWLWDGERWHLLAPE